MDSGESHHCDECDRRFTQIKVHKALAHLGQQQIICHLCGLQFVKSKRLQRHLMEHRKNKVKCHVCQRKDFEDLKYFYKHLEEHPSLHVFSCSTCEKSFALKNHFDEHIKKKHGDCNLGENIDQDVTERNPVYIDGVLTKIKESPKSLDESEPSQTYLCEHCSKSFDFKKHYDKHMRRKHNNSMFIQSTSKNLLEASSSQNKENHDESSKVFTCLICSEYFNDKNDRDKHSRRKHGDSMFCGNITDNLLKDNTFEIKNSPGNWDRFESCQVLTCPVCYKSFTIQKYLDKHMRRKHDNSVLNETGLLDTSSETCQNLDQHESCQDFTCLICSKSFRFKKDLDDHFKKKHDNITMNENSNDSFSKNSYQNGKKKRKICDIDQSLVDNIDLKDKSIEEKFDMSYEKSTSHGNFKKAKIIVSNSPNDNGSVDNGKNVFNISKDKASEENMDSSYEKSKLHGNYKTSKIILSSKGSDGCVDNNKISNVGKVNHEITSRNVDKRDVLDKGEENEASQCQNSGERKSLWDSSNELNATEDSVNGDDDDDNHQVLNVDEEKDDVLDRTCFLCKDVFTGEELFRHYFTQHNDHSSNCKPCGKTLTRRHLYYHALKHNNACPWKCNTCVMTFTCKFYYKRHMNKVHKKVKCYKCKICGENFIYFLPYRAHLLEHNEEEQYSCEHCLKKFRYKKYLAPHLAESKCEQCDLDFNCKTVFEHHLNEVHSFDAIFDCPHCDLKFCKKKLLNLHITRKHFDQVKRKVIYCQFCDYCTHVTYNLTRHVKSRHTHA